MKFLDVLFTECNEHDDMKHDFTNYIEPLKRELEIINSDLVLGKITKLEEQELCKPIYKKIKAFETKYGLNVD